MVVAKKARKGATYKDVLAAPAHKVAEIIDGELFLSPRPGTTHAIAMTWLAGELVPRFGRGHDGPGGWIFMIEPELHFGKQIVVPDMAGWRRERMSSVEDAAFLTLAPDWLCEGLSKSTEKLDRVKKMAVYATAGVRHAWLLDARIRTLEVYRRRGEHWKLVDLFADGELVRAEPFEAFELSMADLWRDLPGRAGEAAAAYAP
jgi:Uma2 family endonuclease